MLSGRQHTLEATGVQACSYAGRGCPPLPELMLAKKTKNIF